MEAPRVVHSKALRDRFAGPGYAALTSGEIDELAEELTALTSGVDVDAILAPGGDHLGLIAAVVLAARCEAAVGIYWLFDGVSSCSHVPVGSQVIAIGAAIEADELAALARILARDGSALSAALVGQRDE